MYSQNIHCKTTLRSCIPTFCFKATLQRCISTILLWSNSMELYSQNISFEAILWNCILKIFSLGQLCGVVFPHFPSRQFCRIAFSKHFIWGNFPELYSHTLFLGNSTELYSQNIFFEAILRNYILKIFHLRQFCGIVFSKYSLWGNFTELYSQNISFKVILQSYILKNLLWDNSTELYSQNLPLWGNSAELYSHTFSFGTTLQNCIPTNVWGHYIPTWIH